MADDKSTPPGSEPQKTSTDSNTQDQAPASSTHPSGAPIDLISALKALAGPSTADPSGQHASVLRDAKDMASYKFWGTQPVPRFDAKKEEEVEDGPMRQQKIEDIPKEPAKLPIDGFEWVTMDLTDEEEMREVHKFLNGHYVEDDDGSFRFDYALSTLKWALMSPGWKKHWHVGIRAGKALCAFIGAVPVQLRVREKTITVAEINFLCVHKKLRSRRLAPVMIKEITRRCNLDDVWQAIYTAGTVLPTPISTTRYFHRSLDWMKLYEVGFSYLPSGKTYADQIEKYQLPQETSTKGLRPMRKEDASAVGSLLTRYLQRYDLVPSFDEEEVEHWFMNHEEADQRRTIWTYVVEDDSGKITDMFSFFRLDSTVLGNSKHSKINIAYLYYYASETGLTDSVDKGALTSRLNELMSDCLILAKRAEFDVFNAVSSMDNALFLEDQKFAAGGGHLHYYLFNYRTKPITGGVHADDQLDREGLSKVGFTML